MDTDYNPPDEDSSDFPIIPAKSRTSTSTLWMVSACVNTFSECNDSLNLWSVTGVPGVGLGSSASLATPAISEIDPPPVAPQKGNSSNPIDTGDGRLLDAAFRDGLLWASGNASCTPPSDTIARSCLQYVEVETGASPTIGRDFPFGTKGAYDYYPSIDLDSADDLITSFTQSSGTEFPSAYVDGRLATEVNNVLGTPVLIEPRAPAPPTTARIPSPLIQTRFRGATIPAPASIPSIKLRFGLRRNTRPRCLPPWRLRIGEPGSPRRASFPLRRRRLRPDPRRQLQQPLSTATATPTASATATPTASGSRLPALPRHPPRRRPQLQTSTSTASGSPTIQRVGDRQTASATATATLDFDRVGKPNRQRHADTHRRPRPQPRL